MYNVYYLRSCYSSHVHVYTSYFNYMWPRDVIITALIITLNVIDIVVYFWDKYVVTYFNGKIYEIEFVIFARRWKVLTGVILTAFTFTSFTKLSKYRGPYVTFHGKKISAASTTMQWYTTTRMILNFREKKDPTIR